MTKQSKPTTKDGNDTTNGATRKAVVRKKKVPESARKSMKKDTQSENEARSRCGTADRQAIVVLGMHRSGTSALTRVLNLCGAALPKQLMPPVSENNDLGFWEPARIYQAHERLLREIGSSWDDVADVAGSFYESNLASQYQREIGALVAEEFGAAALFVIKDPRICRLVPLWHELLREMDAEIAYVLPIRNPLEVALSLKARDGMATNLGLLLWLRHFLSAERDSRGMRRSFCRFEDLLDDWRAVVERISAELEIAFPRMSARAGAEIDEFLVDTARHQRKDDEEVLARRDVLGWVKIAYRWALEASAGGAMPASSILDELDEQLTAAERAFGPIVATEQVRTAQADRRASGFETEVQALQTSLEAKAAETEDLQADLNSIQQRLTQSSEETNRLVRQLEFRDEELTTLMEWSKTVVRWASETITGNVPASPQLGQVLQSLEAAPASQIPMLASEGIELAKQDSLQQQLRTAEEALREAERAAERARAEARDEARAEAETLRCRGESAEKELAAVRADYEDAAKQLKVVTVERDQALQQRDSALLDRERVQGQFDSVTQQYAQVLQQLDRAGVEIIRLKSDLAETAQRQRTLEEQIATVTAERDDALTGQNIANAKRERLQAKLDEIAEAREMEAAQYAEANRNQAAALSERDTNIAALEDAIDGLTNAEVERDRALTGLARSEELIEARDKQICSLDGERLNIAESLTKMRLERDTLRSRTETLAANLKNSQQATVDLQEQIDALRVEGSRHNKHVNVLEQDLRVKQLATEERDALVVIQRQELDRIKSSTVWKLSRPFRAVAGVGEVASGNARTGGRST